jgi:thioredoxin reductase (NADPH)
MNVQPPSVSLLNTNDDPEAYPRLDDRQIARLAAKGERLRTQVGDVLFQAGDSTCDFFVILEGKVAIVEDYGTADERELAVLERGHFLGELNLLVGQAVLVTAMVREAGEVLALPVALLRTIVAEDPALGDLVLRAYLRRRWLLIDLRSGLEIIGSRFSPDTRRLREFLARNRLPHRWIDLEMDERARDLLDNLAIPPAETPVVIVGDRVLRNPSNADLAAIVGLRGTSTPARIWDLLVVGAGPAGLAAAVYAASEGIDTLVLDAIATGGQAGLSPRIENYLGFPSGISGGELVERAVLQAEKFGGTISVPDEVSALEEGNQDGGQHVVRLSNGSTITTRTVLIATGARYRRLDVPGIERFEGTSVFHAATQVEALACGGLPVAVVGGGNSAGQAALFLTRHATKVTLIIRGDALGQDMSRYLADAIERESKIEVLLHTEVRELVGSRTLEEVVVQDGRTGERRRIEARVLFVFIGADPNTAWLTGQVALDEKGYVVTGPAARAAANGSPERRSPALETSRPGVFAAGDVRSGSVKRLTSAVGEGAMVVRMIYEHLETFARSPVGR